MFNAEPVTVLTSDLACAAILIPELFGPERGLLASLFIEEPVTRLASDLTYSTILYS